MVKYRYDVSVACKKCGRYAEAEVILEHGAVKKIGCKDCKSESIQFNAYDIITKDFHTDELDVFIYQIFDDFAAHNTGSADRLKRMFREAEDIAIPDLKRMEERAKRRVRYQEEIEQEEQTLCQS